MVEQFARQHADDIQVIGLGAQDDFAFAQEFLDTTGVETPAMLWDPSFETWQRFGVRLNSEMVLLSPDLAEGTELFFGFGEAEQQAVLESAASLG